MDNYISAKPAAARSINPGPEGTSQVLSQTIGHLDEVEKRLMNIRDRIQVMPEKPAESTLGCQPSGVMGQSIDCRNIAMRLVERCNEIESLIG